MPHHQSPGKQRGAIVVVSPTARSSVDEHDDAEPQLQFRSLKEQLRFNANQKHILASEHEERLKVERSSVKSFEGLVDHLVRSCIFEVSKHEAKAKFFAREAHFRLSVERERSAWCEVVLGLMAEYAEKIGDVPTTARDQQHHPKVEDDDDGEQSLGGDDDHKQHRQRKQNHHNFMKNDEYSGSTCSSALLPSSAQPQNALVPPPVPEHTTTTTAADNSDSGLLDSPLTPKKHDLPVAAQHMDDDDHDDGAAAEGSNANQAGARVDSSSLRVTFSPLEPETQREMKRQRQQQQQHHHQQLKRSSGTSATTSTAVSAAEQERRKRERARQTVRNAQHFERPNPFLSMIERDSTQVPEIVKTRIDVLLRAHGARNNEGTNVVERTAEHRKAEQIHLARSRKAEVLLSTLPT